MSRNSRRKTLRSAGRFGLIGLRARIILASVVCVAAALVVTMAGSAASPSNGTLTATNPILTYTAGPNLVSNPSGTAELNCTELPCDNYTLTVDVPDASYEDTHQVRIHISWPSPAEDYDLNVSDVGSSGNSPGIPETVIAPAKDGTYTVQVVPYAVAGGTFTGTITLERKPVAEPGTGTGTVSKGASPRFETYNPPKNSGLGASAGEPSIGFGKPTAQYPGGRYMFVASLQTLRASFDDCASPAKVTWEDVTAPTTGVTTLDPILESDKDGHGRTIVSQLGPKSSFLAFTDDDGESWTPGILGAPINPGVDHQTIGIGPFVPGGLDSTTGYPSAVYYASQDIAVAQLGISRDGGLTFGPAVPMYNLTQCGGLHGHVTVGPDGTVYVPNKGCQPTAAGVEGGGVQGFAISEDEGTTFKIRTVKNSTSGNNDPSIGVGRGDEVKNAAGAPAGRLYFGYSQAGRPMIAVSDNKGVTFSNPVDVGAPFGIRNVVFPQVIAGDDDRAAFMFLGTPTSGNYQDTVNFKGEWHMYISTTYDGGATWTTVDTTPTDPVQLGSICTGGTTCGADRNLLDFNDLKMDYEGRIVGAYADGCVGCTSPATSRSDVATIVRQSGGPRLLAQFDPSAQSAPLAPRVNSVVKSGIGARLDWAAPDNGGAPITNYNIYRKTGENGAYAVVASINKTTFEDTSIDLTKQYFYKVTAVNANGESESCGEFAVGEAIVSDPCTTPGITILTDPEGDGSLPTGTPVGANDIISVSLAEPFGVGEGKLVFTIKMRDLASPLPPNNRWPVQFAAPDGKNYVVAMMTNASGAVSFAYGQGTTGTVPTTRADPLSNYTPSGIITIVVPRSGVGNAAVGQQLTGFLMRQTAVALTPDNAPDGLGPAGSYTIVGNAFCRPNNAPVAALSANPAMGNAPLNVTLDASGSNDPDSDAPADTIASYTFDFGDGTLPVTQASPTVSHTYNAGNYRATVRVTDSRGKVSGNTAGVNLEVVTPTKPAAPSNLVATAGTGSIHLTWKDNSDNETNFEIQRCQGATCTNFVQVAKKAANTVEWINTPLATNTTYRYRVRALNNSGTSPHSNIVTATTRAIAAPSNLVATAGRGSIHLTWKDNSDNETNFEIQRCQGATCTNFVQVAKKAANTVEWINTPLAANITYRYRVRAINGTVVSPYANIVTATTP